jgi:hypothetical protein
MWSNYVAAENCLGGKIQIGKELTMPKIFGLERSECAGIKETRIGWASQHVEVQSWY